ncbi:hypothetical protein FA15DRAFT_667326 [Coprinopsis marcescibilis]|uniref:Uncharacterized protein n=1 Tax=Coprinopsis marcescibilis TaxID=230819 RepID=A0A5C3L1T1_COPMA|nr:hypothetical protein FA15DRAFT_667326 [Coprinopsis marcescibilis]
MGANLSAILGLGGAHAFQGAEHVEIAGGTVNVVSGNSVVHNHYIVTTLPSHEIAKIAKWLTIINYRVIQVEMLGRRVPKTGTWVLEDCLFLSWMTVIVGYCGALECLAPESQ